MKTINWVLASLIATSSTVALAEEAPTTAVETQTEVTTSEQPAEKKFLTNLMQTKMEKSAKKKQKITLNWLKVSIKSMPIAMVF